MKSVPSLSLAVVLSLAACNAGSAPSEAAQPAIEAHVQDVVALFMRAYRPD